MVTGNRINNNRMLFILTSKFCSDFDVAALNFTVNGFPHIMEEACTSCQINILTQLTCQKTS